MNPRFGQAVKVPPSGVLLPRKVLTYAAFSVACFEPDPLGLTDSESDGSPFTHVVSTREPCTVQLGELMTRACCHPLSRATLSVAWLLGLALALYF